MAQCWLMTGLPPAIDRGSPRLALEKPQSACHELPNEKQVHAFPHGSVPAQTAPGSGKIFSAKGVAPRRADLWGDPSNAPFRALDCALETADEDVDEVVAVGGLDAVRAQGAEELRVRDRRV